VTQPAKIIFNNNSSPQTADLPFVNGGYYNVDGYQATVTTGIKDITVDGDSADEQMYDLQGRRVDNPSVRGIYIINGRKVVR
jgi:hypothetical protein